MSKYTAKQIKKMKNRKTLHPRVTEMDALKEIYREELRIKLNTSKLT